MNIFVNQVGYLPKSCKIGIFTEETDFSIINADTNSAEYEGRTAASSEGVDDASGDKVYHGDFTAVTKEGSYYIKAHDGSCSAKFQIKEHVYNDLKNALIKALYYQRCGIALTEEYAGEYTHKPCHTKKAKVYGHEDIELDVCGGWHDAGDYGRYVTPAAVALAHLLYAYEYMPERFGDLLKIPESGNGAPDILNECRYELEWLLKMQCEDGSVYHKLTAINHAPFLMPEDDHDQFYLFPASTMAAADFAAVMALSSRVYASFDKEFSNKLMSAAKKTGEYLSKHPEYIGFHNPEGSNTGEYDDDCDTDERMWAAAELLRMDKDASKEQKKAYTDIVLNGLKQMKDNTDMGWTNVSGLAGLAVLGAGAEAKEQMPSELYESVKQAFVNEAQRLAAIGDNSGYRLCMEKTDFVWGSNMVALNRGMVLCMAHRLTGMSKYLEAAAEHLNYLLGKNPLGISYVTGFGEKAFRKPHNRPTASDGIEEPMRGWVSGGPNGNPCDETAIAMIPPKTPPMKCYVDEEPAYSVNEITIYWNSPAVFLAAYIDLFTK